MDLKYANYFKFKENKNQGAGSNGGNCCFFLSITEINFIYLFIYLLFV